MEGFLTGLLRISFFGSLSAMVLFFLQPVCRRLAGQAVVYYLWLFVLLRLCVPAGITVSLPSAAGGFLHIFQQNEAGMADAGNPVHGEAGIKAAQESGQTGTGTQRDAAGSSRKNAGVQKNIETETGQNRAGAQKVQKNADAQTAPGTDARKNRNLFWAVLWMGGVLASLAWHFGAGLSYSRRVRRSLAPVPDWALAVLREAEPCGHVALAQSSLVNTPMLLGLRHPVIVLPFLSEHRNENLGNILAHELVHAKRRDLLYKWSAAAITSLHWFNPLMILVRHEIARCCELSCDEAVVRSMTSRERRSYGETLLALAGAPSRGTGTLSAEMCREKAQLKERLVAIAKYRKKSMASVAASLVFVLAAGGCAMISGAEAGKPREIPAGMEQAEDTQDTDSREGQRPENPDSREDKSPENPDSMEDKSPENPDSREGQRPENPDGMEPEGQVREDAADSKDSSTDEGEEPELYYEKDGRQYELVPDLVTGRYLWASVLSKGTKSKDSHGHEKTNYQSQERWFERVDGSASHSVRRFDNLLYSAGEYLIFEYDGMVHVSRQTDIYHPVLSYEYGWTYGIVTKVKQGYMIADGRDCEIRFYNEQFQETKTLSGLRAGESGHYYENGLMAVREMKTGLKGFLDESGSFAIPCIYAKVSDFSNGYASVLEGAQLVPYTEEDTVQMFYAKGGQWGIIDQKGSFVIKPSKRYANKSPSETGEQYYDGIRRFGPVREDGTVDFLASDEEDRVLETVSVR